MFCDVKLLLFIGSAIDPGTILASVSVSLANRVRETELLVKHIQASFVNGSHEAGLTLVDRCHPGGECSNRVRNITALSSNSLIGLPLSMAITYLWQHLPSRRDNNSSAPLIQHRRQFSRVVQNSCARATISFVCDKVWGSFGERREWRSQIVEAQPDVWTSFLEAGSPTGIGRCFSKKVVEVFLFVLLYIHSESVNQSSGIDDKKCPS